MWNFFGIDVEFCLVEEAFAGSFYIGIDVEFCLVQVKLFLTTLILS
jgi:hypothetical protein